jgi:hypothetical protein
MVDFGSECVNYTIHKPYIKWFSWPGLKKKTLRYFELMICDKYRGKNTSPQCVNYENCGEMILILIVGPRISVVSL